MTTEQAWQRRVIALAHVAGWSVGRFSSTHSDPGFPDLILTHPDGDAFALELKSPGGRLESAQRAILLALAAGGLPAHVLRPHEEWWLHERLARRTACDPSANEDRGPEYTLAYILERAAVAFDVTTTEIVGRSRAEPIVNARHAVAYVAHRAGFSYPAIGAAVRRSHTAAMHGDRAVQRRAQHTPSLCKPLNTLCADLCMDDAAIPLQNAR